MYSVGLVYCRRLAVASWIYQKFVKRINGFHSLIRFEDERGNEMWRCILPASGATLEMPVYAGTV